jgi:hypothetical protein
MLFTNVKQCSSELEWTSRFRFRYNKEETVRRGVHVTGVSAAYTFKLNKNILSE